MRHALAPGLLGAAMAALMVAMLHPMPGGWPGAGAALALVAAHGAVLLALLALALLLPGLRQRLRGHRPSLRHMGAMVLGMGGGALVLHLVLHGTAA